MADWAVARCAGADLRYAGIASVGSASVDHASVPRAIVHFAIRGMVVVGTRPAAHSIGKVPAGAAAAGVVPTASARLRLANPGAQESAHSIRCRLGVRRVRRIGFSWSLHSMCSWPHKPQVHPLLRSPRYSDSLRILHHSLGAHQRSSECYCLDSGPVSPHKLEDHRLRPKDLLEEHQREWECLPVQRRLTLPLALPRRCSICRPSLQFSASPPRCPDL